MFGKDIGIDLGTANTIIYERGKGIILREPSVVAIDSKKNDKIIAVGLKAKEMLERTPDSILAVRPLREGVIADYNCTLQMLNGFIRRAIGKRWFAKPRLIICVPSGVTDVEKKAVIEAGLEAGAREVFVAEESIMAAIGAGLPVLDPKGNMVLDIGGGTSEVAVISMGRIVKSKTLRIAGDRFDEDIAQHIRAKYNVVIGTKTAEELKINIGNVFPKDYDDEMEIGGINTTLGLPVNITIKSDEIAEAMSSVAKELLEAVRGTLEITPPELSADVITNGIYLTGGGALIRGLDKYISKETGNIPVYIAEDPLDCVAVGAGRALENLDYLSGATRS